MVNLLADLLHGVPPAPCTGLARRRPRLLAPPAPASPHRPPALALPPCAFLPMPAPSVSPSSPHAASLRTILLLDSAISRSIKDGRTAPSAHSLVVLALLVSVAA
ncbi:hypothetical protein ZWY2020_031842 [Hordeum vulgare]|nr:hypothetical protein ZWY2020_031842 [Hordeum vulgare]